MFSAWRDYLSHTFSRLQPCWFFIISLYVHLGTRLSRMASKDSKEDKDALDALELEAKEFDKVSCDNHISHHDSY